MLIFEKEISFLNLLTFPSSVYFIAPIFLWGLIYGKRWFFLGALVLLLISTQLNVLLKEFFQIPLNPILGLNHVYAFPSGHMQNTCVLWGSIAWAYKKPSLTFLIFTILSLNGFAIYALGFHAIIEIIGGCYFAVLILLTAFKFFVPWTEKALRKRN